MLSYKNDENFNIHRIPGPMPELEVIKREQKVKGLHALQDNQF